MAVVLKALAYFIVIKALSSLFFPKPLTIFAAALIAFVICIIEYFAYMEMTRRTLEPEEQLAKTAALGLLWILSSGVVVATIITFAFSETFWMYSLGQGWRSYGSFFAQPYVLFIVAIAMPTIANWLFFIVIARNMRRDFT